MSESVGARPLHLRIVDWLRNQIETGKLPPGAQIPSNQALMEQFGVSSQTAQRAIRALKSEGVLEAIPGKGVYVRQRRQLISRSASYLAPAAEGAKAPYRGKSEITDLREVVPPDDIAEALGLEVDATAFLRRRTMLIEHEPVEIVASYYPLDIAQGTALTAPGPLRGGSPAELKRLGFDSHHAVEIVQTRPPTPEEARVLWLSQGTSVFRLLRSVYTAEERVIEVLDMILGGDRYQLRYELPIYD